MSKKLELNLGLRWDSPGAIHEKNNLDSVFLPTLNDPLGSFTNPITGSPQQLLGQVVLVDSAQYPSRYERKQKHDLFSPRMGFAYGATPTTVLRGGFGISFARTIGTDVGPRISPINQATTTMVSSLNGGVTPNATLSNPFPNTTLNKPVGRNQAALSALTEGLGFNQMVPYQPWSYAESWNLSLQQQFTHASVMTLSYAGSAGVHLSRSGGYNSTSFQTSTTVWAPRSLSKHQIQSPVVCPARLETAPFLSANYWFPTHSSRASPPHRR